MKIFGLKFESPIYSANGFYTPLSFFFILHIRLNWLGEGFDFREETKEAVKGNMII